MLSKSRIIAENMTAARMLANVVDFSKSCSNHCTIWSPGTSLWLVASMLVSSTGGSNCIEEEWLMVECIASLM